MCCAINGTTLSSDHVTCPKIACSPIQIHKGDGKYKDQNLGVKVRDKQGQKGRGNCAFKFVKAILACKLHTAGRLV